MNISLHFYIPTSLYYLKNTLSFKMFKMFVYPLIKQKTYRMNLRNIVTVNRFYDPTNDIAFIKLFGEEQSKPLLLSFLNSVLRRDDDNMIEKVELMPQQMASQ